MLTNYVAHSLASNCTDWDIPTRKLKEEIKKSRNQAASLIHVVINLVIKGGLFHLLSSCFFFLFCHSVHPLKPSGNYMSHMF
jgi:hypothetical protein